jgi:formate dehydrogenase subunit delta
MSSSKAETLVRMANQITKAFHPQGEERAVAAVSEHLMKFWEPRMKDGIFAHMDAGGAGLDAWTLKALQKLRVAVEAKKKAAAAHPGPVPGPNLVQVAQPVQQAKAKASAGKAAKR